MIWSLDSSRETHLGTTMMGRQVPISAGEMLPSSSATRGIFRHPSKVPI